jgi:branched-chain amino acid transport system permease protein
MPHSWHRLAWGVLLVAIVAAPFVLPPTIATEILIFALVAVSANLLIGYGGLFSFGQAAFFGIGGYVCGYLLANYDLGLLVPLLAGAVSGGASAALVAFVLVRRVGIYFIMLTFAFNQMVYYTAYSWRSVTGGEDGLAGITRPKTLLPNFIPVNLDDATNFYVLVAVVLILGMAALLRITASPLGKVLLAAKENPRRVSSIGYNVYSAQTVAFAISGTFTGLAGALYPMLYWIMPIDAVHWLNSGYIVFMVLIGGTSSMFGPVIGAAIFILLQDFFSTIWARWPLLFGGVIIAVVLFLQGGVIELFTRLGRLVRHGDARPAGPTDRPEALPKAPAPGGDAAASSPPSVAR